MRKFRNYFFSPLYLLTVYFYLLPSSQAAVIPDPEAYRKEHCQKMLSILNAGYPQTQIEVINHEKATPEQRAFVDFYVSQVNPLQAHMNSLSFQVKWTPIAIDRALYENEAQKSEWLKSQATAQKELNELMSGPVWKSIIQNWGELGRRLSGTLADHARQKIKSLELESFDGSQLALVNRLSEVNAKIDEHSGETPYAKNIPDLSRNLTEIETKYKNGILSFTEAAIQFDAARVQSVEGEPRNIVKLFESELHEAAKIRSELARSKGYRSPAEYNVALQAEAYARFNTVESRIQFLENALAQTDQTLQDALITLLKKDPSVLRKDLRDSHLSLLLGAFLPELDNFAECFPKENISELWRRTQVENGFTPTDLTGISFDLFPRPNKTFASYNTELTFRLPSRLRIDASTLNVQLAPGASWIQPNIFNIENISFDSVDALRSTFHLGGHSLHHSFEENSLDPKRAYAFLEVQSLTQELFLLDRDFLLNKGKTREGKKPTENEVDRYLQNAWFLQFIQFRNLLAGALFELKLWDYDFSNGNEVFVDRAVHLYDEIFSRAMGVSFVERRLFTEHSLFNSYYFRAGDMMTIAYPLARIGAYLTREELFKRFEKESGRKTYDRQPKMAQYLKDAYYRSGSQGPFPKPIEEFTGQSYSEKAYLEFLAKMLAEN